MDDNVSKEKINQKLKYVDEWKISKKAKKIVKTELNEWKKAFLDRGDNPKFQVEKFCLKDDEMFFFTTCHDLMKKDVESKAIEDDLKIRRRKRNVMMSLFMDELIGNEIKINPVKCSHCGFTPMDINHGVNGYYRYCPNCDKVVVDTFVTSAYACTHKMLDDMVNIYGWKKRDEKT